MHPVIYSASHILKSFSCVLSLPAVSPYISYTYFKYCFWCYGPNYQYMYCQIWLILKTGLRLRKLTPTAVRVHSFHKVSLEDPSILFHFYKLSVRSLLSFFLTDLFKTRYLIFKATSLLSVCPLRTCIAESVLHKNGLMIGFTVNQNST